MSQVFIIRLPLSDAEDNDFPPKAGKDDTSTVWYVEINILSLICNLQILNRRNAKIRCTIRKSCKKVEL